MDKSKKVVLTGGAGLVGQNLVLELKNCGYTNIVVIDKNTENLKILTELHPEVSAYNQDVAEDAECLKEFQDAGCVVMLHAQIAGLSYEPFQKNNIDGTEMVLRKIKEYRVPFLVHISSSVVFTKSEDYYTTSKKEQERIVRASGVNHCILRPTLMYGWFDPKHFGWLSRFMERSKIFPIPGKGDFMRQPLYVRDFVRAIEFCIRTQPKDGIFDLVGPDQINYVDIIKAIKKIRKLPVLIVHIPFKLFKLLLIMVAWVHPKPPFTAQQLEALSAGDYFKGTDIEKTFGFKPTHIIEGLKETWEHPVYHKIALNSPH